MRASGRVTRAWVAMTVMAALALVGAPAAQAQHLEWQTVTGFATADDEDPGARAATWYHWLYDTGQFEILRDRSEPWHHDGSLRLATPGDSDYVSVQRTDGAWDYNVAYTGISFGDFTASYELKVVSGEPAAYQIRLGCSAQDPPVDMTYLGTSPADDGWHRVTVSGGQTEWTASRPVGSLAANQPHTLAEYQAQCPDGKITQHGISLSNSPGSVSRVDSVILDSIASNFQHGGLELTGTAHADRLVGGRFADRILGRGGDDTLIGRQGSDFIKGERGADHLRGGDGADEMYGGVGPDVLIGGRGRDGLYGQAGRNRFYDGPGADAIWAGNQPDLIHLGPGSDRVSAAGGRDRVVVRPDGRLDRIYCGKGVDVVTYIHRRDRHDHLFGCEHIRIRR